MDKKLMGSLVKNARRVKSLDDKRKYTQADFADLIGISRSYLGDIETGRTDPSLDVLLKMADVCNLSLDYFRDKPSGNVLSMPGPIAQSPDTLNVLVVGSSMERSRLRDGDIAIISKSEEVNNGDIVLVAFNTDQSYIRKVFYVDKSVIFEADSYEPSIPPIYVEDLSTVRIIGKVVKAIINI